MPLPIVRPLPPRISPLAIFSPVGYRQGQLGQIMSVESQLEAHPDCLVGIVLMNEVPKATEVNQVAAMMSLVRIEVPAAQDLVRVVERVQDRAFAGAVWPEEQRYRPQLNPYWRTNPLEVL